MRVEVSSGALEEGAGDLQALGLLEGQELPEALRELPGAADVKASFKRATMLRPPDGRRVLVVGLGEREDLDRERAREIAAAHDAVTVDVLDRDQMAERGMGGLAAVSSGSETPPRLIALRYAGGRSERIGFVGKGVTFDSGGISIKPAQGMQEMK